VYKSNNSRRIPSRQANSPENKEKSKMKIKEKYYAQKFNSKQVSCHPRESQQALQRPKKAQQSSNPTQQSLSQENKQGKVVYVTVQEKSVYIRSLQ
jgi:hypothetical protein